MVMLSEEGGIAGDEADDLAEAIMNDVDENKDGIIDFREFCKAFAKRCYSSNSNSNSVSKASPK